MTLVRGTPVTEHEMRFVLPMPPNNANPASGTGHWWTLAKMKKVYYQTCDGWQAAGVIPAPPARPWSGRISVSAIMHVGGRMDEDNALYRFKFAMDWLATRGYIANDRTLRWLAQPTQVVSRTQDFRLVLTLTR